MQRINQEEISHLDDEIKLTELFNSLIEKSFLIVGITFSITVLAILYVLNITPTYQATSSFTSPSSISISNLQKLNFINEIFESEEEEINRKRMTNFIFSEFLTRLSSKNFQKETFIEGDFLTIFNENNLSINNIDAFILGITSSVRVINPKVTLKTQQLGFLNEAPYSVTMEGTNPKAISEFVNKLVSLANQKTISSLIDQNEIMVFNRLEELYAMRDKLLNQAKDARLAKIARIKEQDNQNIKQINDEINRARITARSLRLNQIEVLKDAAELASSLGIIENNFELINIENNSSDLTISIGEGTELPEWYLFGEKALNERIRMLVNRESDDPYTPELIKLKNQLNAVENNNLFNTLKSRQDDSPFIEDLIELNSEIISLESNLIDISNVNAMQLNQASSPYNKPIKPEKRKIVLIAFIAGFVLSIFLVLIMSILRPNKNTLA